MEVVICSYYIIIKVNEQNIYIKTIIVNKFQYE